MISRRLGHFTGGSSPFYAISWLVYGKEAWSRRDYVEVFAITEGEGFMNVLDEDGMPRVLPATPGQLFFCRPRDTYRMIGSFDVGLGGYVVSMPVSSWQNFAALVGLSPSWLTVPESPSSTFDATDPHVLDPFRRAVGRYRNGATLLDLAEFLVAVLPSLLPASQAGARQPDPPTWLTDALDAMNAEENLRAGVPRLLTLSRVSASHLSRVAHRFFGLTPTQLVRELRIQHAAMLLSTTSHNISAIASRCGFVNASHFSTAFRRVAYVSPRDYREQRMGGFLNASVTRVPSSGHGLPGVDRPHPASVAGPVTTADEDDDRVVVFGP